MTALPGSPFSTIVRGGTVHDGIGSPGRLVDIGISGDRIEAVGPLEDSEAPVVLDATGLVVAPGFINVLSHSEVELLRDPRGLSELVQGVTTQIFGEGLSMGPFVDATKVLPPSLFADLDIEPWAHLGQYLDLLDQRGTAQNVGSLVGATNLRLNTVGNENRPATPQELDAMTGTLREELEDGGLGLGSALIYPPATFAPPQELLALARVVQRSDGAYFSHVRGEGEHLLKSLTELIDVAQASGVRAEVYHLKASGKNNWPLMVVAVQMIEDARDTGLSVTADMYPYTASSTGLWTLIPSRYFEDGPEGLFASLSDPRARSEILETLRRSGTWEQRAATTTIIGLSQPELAQFAGLSLGRIAEILGTDPPEAVVELIRQEHTRVPAVFSTMSEENVSLGLSQPWVSIGSDGRAIPPAAPWTDTPVHPRGYGAFARFLGRYVREQQLVPLTEAIRRMTSLPAQTLNLHRRGEIAPGYFADLVIFNPDTVIDTATYSQPHSLATGVEWVLVNGELALDHGLPTGRLPGRTLRRR